ncbi:hypothetical protein NPX13_g7059 [Xylaria arbuscula]|uniref:DUF6536 domain-containing protein n=1 Tax=Xylaria arbuscula TaxID=114810 RepID=A0A9W8NBE2_9PEZI|nr:hypothetical protein NPX13_g7059 [Xylaria arbuscula]
MRYSYVCGTDAHSTYTGQGEPDVTVTGGSAYSMPQATESEENPLPESHEEDTPCLDASTADTLITDGTPFRVDGFADRHALAGWFPRIDDDEKTSLRIQLSKRSQALLLQVALIATILGTNLFILLYASSKYPARDGVGLLYAGNCDTVKTANRLLHLLINVLSTGMLSASTYCIQLQASPTRGDIDRMHKLNRWLDIGAPSLRNLRHVDRWRVVSCIVLALSSLPIHLIYNSAVFQSLASNDYSVAVVKESFLSGADWDLSTAQHNGQADPGWNEEGFITPSQGYSSFIESMQKDVMGGDIYQRKNISECYELYEDYWAVDQGNVVIVVDSEKGSNNSLLLYTFVAPRYDNYAKNLWAASNGTAGHISFSSSPPPYNTLFLGPPRYQASYCLVQFVSGSTTRCRLQYSTHILTAVCALNFVKLLVLAYVWASKKKAERRRKIKNQEWGAPEDVEEHILARKDTILSTLGDAVASFMQDPDETTRDMCLATKYDFLQQGKGFFKNWRKEKPKPEPHPRKWKMSQKRWMSGATRPQWTCLIILYIGFLVGIYTSLGLLVTSLRHRHFDLTLSFFRSLGFGAVSELTYLNVRLPRGDPIGLILNVLIINSPQLLFSIMYSVCGAVMTTLLVQREFSLMYTRAHRKPLRVSEPVGIQRSSYFISLPLRYGIPLNLFSAVFHWLISQSFFLARITALMPDGTEDYGNSFSTLGYSPYAVIITGIVAFSNMMAIIMIGCRKYDGTMSMVSTNSMAISAACHSLPEDREFGHQLPLQWGVVEINQEGIGHCAFTTAPYHVIRKAQDGILYQ